MASMIEVFGVGKTFDRNTLALWDISFSVNKGQFFALSGPADSGKTTLLRIICGHLKPTEGHVLVDGVNVAGLYRGKRRDVFGALFGIAPANPLILKSSPAIRTIQIALSGAGIHGANAMKKAMEVLELAGLSHRAKSLTSALSEVERRSLSIARALAIDPKVLLVDEPLLGLDKPTATEIITLLNRASESGVTVLMATRAIDAWEAFSPVTVRLLAGRIQH
ncbi:MAG: ATP-binding cassette domain-containing protein [Candidatus Coatesbacteria bacterium]|nr:ATP-binding cassette domain-containing protein [Candidatus Coatesbacteria bacterium]